MFRSLFHSPYPTRTYALPACLAILLGWSLWTGAQPLTAQVGREGPAEASLTPLINRERISLNQAGTKLVLEGAQAQAQTMKLAVNIAVVDEGGHLLGFVRMDGARPASVYTALTKATAAATLRQPTGPLPPGSEEPNVWLNLSLQHTAAASGGKVTTLYGGVPIVVDGQVVGAVGVGGGTGEQDAQIARAGIDKLLTALGSR